MRLALATRRQRAWAVFGVALAIALVFRLLASPHAPHDYFVLGGMPWSDALAYHLSARDLLDGWGLRENLSFPVLLHTVRAPGYVALLAAAYAFGLGPAGVAIVQCILHAATCALVYRIGAHVMGERAGIVAALAVALSRTQLDFAGLVMTETLAVFLGAYATWLALRGRTGWAGLIVGLAATARPACLVLAPIVAARARAWRPIALALGLAALPTVALSARNAAAVGSFSPASTYHIWTTWSEFVPPNPDSSSQHFTAFVPLLDRSEREQREIFSRDTRGFFRAHPLAYLRHVWHFFESNFRIPAEQGAGLSELVLLPLLLFAGWGVARARRRGAVLMLLAYPVLFLGGTAVFGESSGRFRLPVDWALTLLVTGGLMTALRLEGEALAEPEPEPAPAPAPRRFAAVTRLAAMAVPAVLVAVPLVRAARAPEPERTEIDPARLGVEPLSRDQYVRALFTDPQKVEGKLVAFAGVVDGVAHFAAGAGDPRSSLLAPRPYGHTLCVFQIDGRRGPLDGLRVFLEVPDELGWRPPARGRAVIKARIETNLGDPSRERARLVALAVLPL